MSSRSVFGRFLLRDNAFAFVSASMRMVRPVSKSACAHVGSEFCFGINKQTRRKFHAILSTCQVIEAHHRAGCRSFGGLLGLQEIQPSRLRPARLPLCVIQNTPRDAAPMDGIFILSCAVGAITNLPVAVCQKMAVCLFAFPLHDVVGESDNRCFHCCA